MDSSNYYLLNREHILERNKKYYHERKLIDKKYIQYRYNYYNNFYRLGLRRKKRQKQPLQPIQKIVDDIKCTF